MKKILKWLGILFAGLIVLGILLPSEAPTDDAFDTSATASVSSSAIFSEDLQTTKTSVNTSSATTQTTITIKKTTPTIIPTPLPLVTTTSKKLTTRTTASTKKATKTTVSTQAPPLNSDTMVWIPTNGGKKYHKKSTCSKMIDPEYVTLTEAKNRGFTACGICYK